MSFQNIDPCWWYCNLESICNIFASEIEMLLPRDIFAPSITILDGKAFLENNDDFICSKNLCFCALTFYFSAKSFEKDTKWGKMK